MASKKPPFERYVFMLNAVDDGYGGLEHRASTALIAARRDLPRRGQNGQSDGYVTLLGLISHEYFHTWNVKRLRPAEFARYDYTSENYTRLLWFFEGFTSYYDDLFLVRSALIDEARYLKLLAKNINAVLGTPGRKVQSVAQASFDAWVKYYRGDENTVNATISYYTKGSLLALALDSELAAGRQGIARRRDARFVASKRRRADRRSRDRTQAVQAVAGRSLEKELAAWVHGTDDLPLETLAVEARRAMEGGSADAGAALGCARGGERAHWRASEERVAGQRRRAFAGSAAGDELLAVNGWRLRRIDDVQLLSAARHDAGIARVARSAPRAATPCAR